MKKSIILFAVALGMLTACSPQKEEKGFDVTNITADKLLDGATFSQYNAIKDEAGNITGYEEAADGNWIKYNIPNVSSVFIFYLKPDGTEFKLASGSAGGMFNFVPARGSDTNQTVYFRFINQNGEEVIASKDFTLQVAGELEMPVRFIASNDYGEKVWTWDAGGDSDAGEGRCWGNMGSPGSGDGFIGNYIWWGVSDAADLTGQLAHSVTGQATGEEDNAAYMIFTEDGLVNTYTADGTKIRGGSYEIKNYDPNGTWQVGTLHVSEPATLFPFEINAKDHGGVRYVTEFEIHKLTSDKLVLVYPDNGVWDGWSEGTYWCFKSNSDGLGMLQGYDTGKDWTWDAGGDSDAGEGRCWGNMGSPGSGDGFIGNYVWWGVSDAADLTGQLGHSVTGQATGEEDNNAYMTFSTDGIVTTFAADGSKIRSGSFELQNYDTSNTWQVATLHVSEPGTLFPFEINAKDHGGVRYVTDFEVHKLTGNKLVLAYPDNGKWDGWSEGTYWCFKTK